MRPGSSRERLRVWASCLRAEHVTRPRAVEQAGRSAIDDRQARRLVGLDLRRPLEAAAAAVGGDPGVEVRGVAEVVAERVVGTERLLLGALLGVLDRLLEGRVG